MPCKLRIAVKKSWQKTRCKVYFELWLSFTNEFVSKYIKVSSHQPKYIIHIQSGNKRTEFGNNAGLNEPTTHFINTESDQELYYQNNSYTSLTFADYHIIVDWNFNIDLLTAKTTFIVVIDYDFDLFDPAAMRIDIYARIMYNTDQIIVCSTFNSMAFIIDTFVKIMSLTSFVNTFTIIFTGIPLHSDKRSKFEYNYINHSNINIINTFIKISGTAIVIGFFLDVIYFVTQVIDESSLNITLSIKLHAIIVEITQLVVYLGIQSLNSTVDFNAYVIHNVCDVFYYLFIFIFFFLSWYMLNC